MRVALIADIQGNSVALETILHELSDARVDVIICLGDVATGPQPLRVLDMMRDCRCLTVMGNMDDAILTPLPYLGTDPTERKYAEIDQWCHDQLNADDKGYIRDFSPTVNVYLDDAMHLLCCHGSPRSFDDVIIPTTPDTTLQRLLTGFETDILATGHMHVQFLRRFRETVIVSPGSIGLPNPAGDKNKRPLLAEYAILTFWDGHLSVDFHSQGYSSDRFMQSVLNSGMPHAQWYLDHWYIG